MDTFFSSWYQTDSFDALNGCANNLAVMALLLFLGLYIGLLSNTKGLTWFSFMMKSQQTMLRSSSTQNSELDWWKDLAPPFALAEDDLYPSSTTEDEDESDFSESSEQPPEQRSTVTHFCFLVHGHRGYSRDLSYLQHKMERVAREVQKQRRKERLQQISNMTPEERDSVKDYTVHQLVVHSVVCNEKKTDDGVVNGGERLVEEMISTIREEMSKRRPFASNGTSSSAPDNLQNVTISMIGNSLGGIYSRYAIAKLSEKCDPSNTTACTLVLDGRYALHFNVFCTTATPHLGIAGHTFFPIPRTAEIGVAHAMGDTGRDLFRLNDLMKRMATTNEFLQPLRAFRKRIAYANAYATDFPVPVRTAAFLSESSSYPHHFVVDDGHGDDKVVVDDKIVVDDNGLVIATLHTPAQPLDNDKCFVNGEENDDLVEMSRSLDSLGWKKVFIDVRNVIPRIPLPSLPTALSRISRRSSSDNSEAGASENIDKENENEISERSDPVNVLKQKGNVVSSRDVAAALSTHPLFGDEILRWPRGHNMIVAFSRDPLSTYLNKAGRPVVNSLATEIVNSIFAWNQTDITEQNNTREKNCKS